MISLQDKKFLLFDLDGTLVDLENLNYECFRVTTKKLSGNELTFDEYMTYMAGVGSKQGFLSYYAAQKLSLDNTVAATEFKNLKRHYLTEQYNSVVHNKEGVLEFLAAAKRAGKILAIGTSSRKEFADIIIKNSGILSYMDAIVAVDDVKRTKPAPDIFLEALRRVNGVREKAVIFEDSPSGALSAIHAKMDVIIMHNPGKNDRVASKYPNTIESYKELLGAL